jgi:hypothetical protein
MSVVTAARYLGISRSHAYELILAGKIPPSKARPADHRPPARARRHDHPRRRQNSPNPH